MVLVRLALVVTVLVRTSETTRQAGRGTPNQGFRGRPKNLRRGSHGPARLAANDRTDAQHAGCTPSRPQVGGPAVHCICAGCERHGAGFAAVAAGRSTAIAAAHAGILCRVGRATGPALWLARLDRPARGALARS